mgnify:CR=1 FL=1
MTRPRNVNTNLLITWRTKSWQNQSKDMEFVLCASDQRLTRATRGSAMAPCYRCTRQPGVLPPSRSHTRTSSDTFVAAGEDATCQGFAAPIRRQAPRPCAMPLGRCRRSDLAGHAPASGDSISAAHRRPRTPPLVAPAGSQTSPCRSKSSVLAAPRCYHRGATAQRRNPRPPDLARASRPPAVKFMRRSVTD